jgi:hypothetical protein
LKILVLTEGICGLALCQMRPHGLADKLPEGAFWVLSSRKSHAGITAAQFPSLKYKNFSGLDDT